MLQPACVLDVGPAATYFAISTARAIPGAIRMRNECFSLRAYWMSALPTAKAAGKNLRLCNKKRGEENEKDIL